MAGIEISFQGLGDRAVVTTHDVVHRDGISKGLLARRGKVDGIADDIDVARLARYGVECRLCFLGSEASRQQFVERIRPVLRAALHPW